MVLTAEDRQECEAITATLTAKYQFPVFSKVTSITDPLSQVTGFQYDARGNLKAPVDPFGNRTMITYNVTGQPITTTDALGRCLSTSSCARR